MVRIWYSVCGDGMGHAVRSRVIVEHLAKKHDLLITGYDRSYSYLQQFGKIHRLVGNYLYYHHNSLRTFTSLFMLLAKIPFFSVTNFNRLCPLLGKFKPQLIISDFESCAHYASRILGIPCISLDNNHALVDCETPYHYLLPLYRFLHPKSTARIITSFVPLHSTSSATLVTTPILRDKIVSAAVNDQKHVLVYQTSQTNLALLRVLEQFHHRRFLIYGMDSCRSLQFRENCIFKVFNDEKFIDDLASSSYVITNGGFTTISEALYLGKPVLTIPIRHQKEQEFNASCINKSGFGMATSNLTSEQLAVFEQNLSTFQKNVNVCRSWNPTEPLRLVDGLISSFHFLPSGYTDVSEKSLVDIVWQPPYGSTRKET